MSGNDSVITLRNPKGEHDTTSSNCNFCSITNKQAELEAFLVTHVTTSMQEIRITEPGVYILSQLHPYIAEYLDNMLLI